MPSAGNTLKTQKKNLIKIFLSTESSCNERLEQFKVETLKGSILQTLPKYTIEGCPKKLLFHINWNRILLMVVNCFIMK